MFVTRARMGRNIERWHARGWINDEGITAIRNELQRAQSRFGLASVLGVLGAVLIGFAAMTFVAANWQAMPKLARLFVIFGALWLSYGVAALLYWRGQPKLAQGAILAGIGIFGAGIMLIAQIYHMDGNPPDAVLVWALGALATGLLTRARAALGAAMVLTSFWSSWQIAGTYEFHAAFLLVWAMIGAAFYWVQWRPGFHLAMAALAIWIILLGAVFDGFFSHWLVAGIGVGIAVLAAIASSMIERYAPISKAILAYGIAIGFVGLFTAQFLDHLAAGYLLVWAIITLVLLIGAIFWGWLSDNRAALWLGYAGFSIEILSLYFKTLGTLLGTSLFFLIAGVLVIGLSGIAFQIHKHQSTTGVVAGADAVEASG